MLNPERDDRRRDGGTNFILRIKEQETRLTLHEHDDDDNDDDEIQIDRGRYCQVQNFDSMID
jgi:phosphotransferase system IIB component